MSDEFVQLISSKIAHQNFYSKKSTKTVFRYYMRHNTKYISSPIAWYTCHYVRGLVIAWLSPWPYNDTPSTSYRIYCRRNSLFRTHRYGSSSFAGGFAYETCVFYHLYNDMNVHIVGYRGKYKANFTILHSRVVNEISYMIEFPFNKLI